MMMIPILIVHSFIEASAISDLSLVIDAWDIP